jgi:hypothetical protein
MATLRDLREAILPSARTVAPPAGPAGEAGGSEEGPDPGEREVGWVRVLRARVPAFDALEATDLAIIPGPALGVVAPSPAQLDDLAAALVRARVPAVLLIEGGSGDEALDALGAAGAAAGLTVLRMPRTDPVALERIVIGFLVNRRAELDHRAGELETELARLALLGRGVDVLAATIGTFFGRAVVIEGPRGDPIAVHAPEDAASTGAIGAYAVRPASATLRIPLQAPAGEPGAGGRLVLLGEEPANEFERIATRRIAALLSLELARDAAVRQAREETRRGDPLPTDGPPWVVLVARQSDGQGADALAAREAVRSGVRLLGSSGRLVLRGSVESLELRLVAAAPAGDDPEGLVVADRVATFLGRVVAVSRPFGDAARRPAAEAAARATLEAAEALADPPRIARAARLPAYRLLGDLHNLPDGARQALELLGPILVGRDAVQRERLATLRAVLETSSLAEAAARLAVHRNTIAYRLARLEALGGWDLSDPDLRLALAVASRLVRNDQRREDS